MHFLFPLSKEVPKIELICAKCCLKIVTAFLFFVCLFVFDNRNGLIEKKLGYRRTENIFLRVTQLNLRIIPTPSDCHFVSLIIELASS